MLRLRQASRLHLKQGRQIFDIFNGNGQLRRMTRILRTLKRISLSKILLLICHHHQLGPNYYWYNQLRKTRIVVFVRKDFIVKVKAKVRILLLLASTLLPSRRTKIRTRRILLVRKKVIMLTSILKKSQKTSVGLDNLHVND